MSDGGDDICRAKIGLLILRDCGVVARGACDLCGRPVCKQHRLKTSFGSNCPECCSQKDLAAKAVPVRRSKQRREIYQREGYRPYYYGYGEGAYFDDYDHRTFDAEEHAGWDPLAEITPGLADTDEGRDWLGLDDFGES